MPVQNHNGGYIGRFQPFHHGHLHIIKSIIKQHGICIVVIGSANKSFEWKNPFTVDERKPMIERSLTAEDRDHVLIYSVEDIANNGEWARYVMDHVYPFKTLYTNNPLTALLFRRENIMVKHAPTTWAPEKQVMLIPGSEVGPSEMQEQRLSASLIRQLIAQDHHRWKRYVPQGTIDVIKEVDGVNRIKVLGQEE